MLKRALFILSLLSAITSNSLGQGRPTNLKLTSEGARALTFFEQIETHSFDDYLRRIRPHKVSDAYKTKALTQVTTGEIVTITNGMQAKLSTLAPVLRYHERDSVIEIRVINLNWFYIGLQARAVLLISEPALRQLSIVELQAAVAHELGHEYFWTEFMEAREQKKVEMMREIELRCDGIAVITLQQLGIDPLKLVTMFDKIRAANARQLYIDNFFHPRRDDRVRFILVMDELVKSKNAIQAMNK